MKANAQRLAEKIHGRSVTAKDQSRFRLEVTSLRPVKFRTGWFYITVKLVDSGGRLSSGAIMKGIVSGGGRGVAPWFECRLYPEVGVEGGLPVDTRGLGLEAGLVNLLGKLVPPGGHLMVDYEHEGQQQTFAELSLGVPPVATALGSIMLLAGFNGAFKDWYFSEGGHEGPRKLQADKPPDARSASRAWAEHRRQMKTLLSRPLPEEPQQAEILSRAQARARMLLRTSIKRPGRLRSWQ